MVIRWRSWVGLDERDVWRRLCDELGGEWIGERTWEQGVAVQFRQGDAILTLDSGVGQAGQAGTGLHTRIRAPFLNQEGFSLLVRVAYPLHEIDRLLGMVDHQVEDPELDRPYIFQGNNDERSRGLCRDPAVRTALINLKGVRIQYFGIHSAWYSTDRPPGVDALCLAVAGLVVDLPTLKEMLALVQGVLAQLECTKPQSDDPVEREIGTLLAPGGRIREGNLVLWDGDPPRRRAVESLCRSRDPRAVPALVQTLNDPDAEIHARVVQALGEIGDRTALAHLIPLLGRDPADEGAPWEPPLLEAVSNLGAGAVADQIRSALQQPVSVEAVLPAEHRDAILTAFAAALTRRKPEEVRNAALALQEWGAVEQREPLERAARYWRTRNPETYAALDAALLRLQDRSRLPRPTAAPAPELEHLPIPGREAVPGAMGEAD